MARTRDSQERIADVLELFLVFHLFSLGVPQDRIAKAIGRQKVWVNSLVKGLGKGGTNEARAKR